LKILLSQVRTLRVFFELRSSLFVCKHPRDSLSFSVSLSASPAICDRRTPPLPPTNRYNAPTATGHLLCQISPSASSEYITVHFRCGRFIFLVPGPSASMRQRPPVAEPWSYAFCELQRENLIYLAGRSFSVRYRFISESCCLFNFTFMVNGLLPFQFNARSVEISFFSNSFNSVCR